MIWESGYFHILQFAMSRLHRTTLRSRILSQDTLSGHLALRYFPDLFPRLQSSPRCHSFSVSSLEHSIFQKIKTLADHTDISSPAFIVQNKRNSTSRFPSGHRSPFYKSSIVHDVYIQTPDNFSTDKAAELGKGEGCRITNGPHVRYNIVHTKLNLEGL